MKHKKLLMAVGILILVVGIPFAYWTISPIFRFVEVQDEIPGDINMDTATTSGPFTVVPTTGHPASGTLRVIESNGETVLRYENFKTLNGPDLRVYLASDLKATKYVDLGDLKGTQGNINYIVPKGTDLSQYPYVLTWCRAFSVLFNSVKIN